VNNVSIVCKKESYIDDVVNSLKPSMKACVVNEIPMNYLKLLTTLYTPRFEEPKQYFFRLFDKSLDLYNSSNLENDTDKLYESLLTTTRLAASEYYDEEVLGHE
jgi:hypothetical protein